MLTLPGFGAQQTTRTTTGGGTFRGPDPYEQTPATQHSPSFLIRLHRDVRISIISLFDPQQSSSRVRSTSLPSNGYLKYAARGTFGIMVVVDEKTMLPPPPAYSSVPRAHPNEASGSPVAAESLHPPPFSAPFRKLATLSDLPSHLLLHIVHRTFPQAPDKSYNKLERQRKTLRWLTTSLRLVNRTFYIGMSLRSSYFAHVVCAMAEAEARPFGSILPLSCLAFPSSCGCALLPLTGRS